MIKYAIHNGIIVTVVVMLFSIFGLIALLRTPVQMTPDLDAKTVSVITQWPGATPQDIEKEILVEQEKYLRSISNLERMIATATTGQGQIELEFASGINLDEILVRVNNALSQVPSYPENVDQPRINTNSASDQPIAWFALKTLPGNPKKVEIAGMADFVRDNIQTAFERVNGVSQSESFGGASRQLKVMVNPGELAARHISILELREALRARNSDVSGGDLDDGKRRFLVRTMGRFHDERDVLGTIIAVRDGQPVYLRDVGTVEFTHAEVRARVRHQGEPAMAVNARRQPGSNVIEVMDALKATVKELNEGLLKENGLFLRQVSDDTIYIRESVEMVKSNLILGGILASIVLFLFLRSVPATFIGALPLPICTVCSFLGLTIAGRTINVISLAGVAFAIGMTVDNAIVVLENIYQHLAKGKTALQAAMDATDEVWTAVLASTLTTVMVFLPIVLMKEEAGQLFKDIAIAITAAIVFSMAVAILVIPAAAARMLSPATVREEGADHSPIHTLFGLVGVASSFGLLIERSLRWLMLGVARRVAVVVGMTAMSFGFIWLLTPRTDYLPDGNQNVLFAFMFPPPGYNLQEMTDIGKGIEEQFKEYIEADPEDFHTGKSKIPAIQDFFFVVNTQFMLTVARTVDSNDLDALIPEITSRYNQVPGMIAFARRRSIFSTDLAGSRGIDLEISGTNLPQIFQVAMMTYGKLRQELTPAIRPQPPSLVFGQPMLEVRPDWEAAARLGVNARELGYSIWALTDGAYLDDFFLEADKIDMFLYSSQGTVRTAQDLENVSIYSAASGQTIPLSSVASVRETVNTETIRRVDRNRAVTLTAVPPDNVPLEAAVDIIQTKVIDAMRADGTAPKEIGMRIAGASDKLKATRNALAGNFLLAVVISYLLLVGLLKSWGYPFIIMMSVPLGIAGGIVGLHVMNHGGDYFGLLGMHNVNQPLDILTMMGFVILVGTVVNNPILIVERTLQLVRDEGKSIVEAVVEATSTRVRPIMMSTATTVFGLSPLVFVPGAGTELYRGLGTVVLFGLFFSTIFTLTFIPSLLSLIMQGTQSISGALQRTTASKGTV